MITEKLATERFAKLISEDVDITTLAGHLDKVLWGYAMYMLRDEELCGHPANTESIFFVKCLRDILTEEENI